MTLRYLTTAIFCLFTLSAIGQALPLRVGTSSVETRGGDFEKPTDDEISSVKEKVSKRNPNLKGKALTDSAIAQINKKNPQVKAYDKYANDLLARQKVHIHKADSVRSAVNKSFNTQRSKLATNTELSPQSYATELIALEAKEAIELQKQQPYLDLAEYYAYLHLNRKHGSFLPVRSREHTPLYFESQSAGRNAEFLSKAQTAVNPSTGKLSLYNELFADYVGWFRMGFGTTIVGSNQGKAITPEEQKNENAVQRLVGGGGNGLLTVAYPLLNLNTADKVAAIKVTSLAKLAGDLPQTGGESGDFAYHSNLGISLFGYYTGSKSILTPFIYLHYGESWGNSIFYDNLGRNEHSSISLNQLSAGLDVKDVLLISGSYYYGSTFITSRFPFSISLTLQSKKPASEVTSSR